MRTSFTACCLIAGATVLVLVVGAAVGGCGLHRPEVVAAWSATGPLTASSQATSAPADGLLARTFQDAPSVRVGGDTEAAVTEREGVYRSGTSRITTPLPEGYPAPTPPGAIELKRYPVVRRAAIAGTMSPDWGMNFAFLPLFRHIERRDIAMTSPVEVDYQGLDNGSSRPREWTLSFLYRHTGQGDTGVDPRDERILIHDLPPMTVVAIGLRGGYGLGGVRAGLDQLQRWLEEHPAWRSAGAPRGLFYNGPDVASRDRWFEVQVPVEPNDDPH